MFSTNKWEGMGTAPKTGHAVLLWCPEHKNIYCAAWRSESKALGVRGGWRIFGGDWKDDLQRATRWQPLPEPPDALT